MTVFRILIVRIAAVGVCVGLLAGMANAQISGRVIGPDLTVLPETHIELWDSYPDGTKLSAIFNETDGSFLFDGLAGSTYDVRAWKAAVRLDVAPYNLKLDSLWFPAVVRDVPQPFAGELIIVLAKTHDLLNSPDACDFWDADSSTFLDYPLQRGDVVSVEDGDGVVCGKTTQWDVDTEGDFLVSVFGDYGGTPADEGASASELLTFIINGKPATIVSGDGLWSKSSSFHLRLGSTTNDYEGVSIVPPADLTVLPKEQVDLEFEVTNDGNHPDAFDLVATSIGGWTVTIPGGAASATLDPGQSDTITVNLVFPACIPAQVLDDIYLLATSQTNSVVMGADYAHIEADNQPPVLTAIGAKGVDEGQNLSFGVSASDPDAATLTLTAENVPVNASFTDNGDGTGAFSFDPDDTQAGVYNVSFIVSDCTFADTEIVAITVSEASGILEEQGTVPERYFLAQNYPNPFNPSTQIAFGLQLGGHTTIKVYNLLGQQVSLLLDQFQAAGSHVVTWDGYDNYGQPVPSGIYFYRIQSGEFTQTRKMVLMK